MASRLKALVLVSFACTALAFVDGQLQLAGEAESQLRSGNSQAALEILAKASVAPGTPSGEDRIGFLYASAGHRDEAFLHFHKSIAESASYAPAHFHLGVMLWLAQDHSQGLQELRAAAELDPKTFDYRYRLGSAYLETGSDNKAIQELQVAADLDNTKAEVWQQLGIAQQHTGDLAAAVQSLSKAVALKPGDDSLRNGYSQLLVATRQPDKAIAEAQTVLAHNHSDISAQLNVGYAYLKMGEYTQAEQAFRKLLELDGSSVAGHYDLGIALKMQDQLEAAQSEFKKSIDLDPSLAESHYTLGITNWQLGDFPGTISEMRAALALRSDYAEAHYMLGIALKQNGDLDPAIVELKEAIRLDSTTPGPYNTLGQILRIKGDKAGSEEAFAKGAKLKSDKDRQLANSLDQGMRGNMMPQPITTAK